jgi:oligosaccharide repeat unit polymerase
MSAPEPTSGILRRPAGSDPRSVPVPAVAQVAAPAAKSRERESEPPRPRWNATGIGLAGVIGTAVLASGETSTALAAQAATGIGLALLASLCMEVKNGVKNLIRADIMALVAFYYLTLYEFLFPQPLFDAFTHVESTRAGLWTIYWAVAGLLLGRHLHRSKKQPFGDLMTRPVPVSRLLTLYWAAAFLGYSHMLFAVNFDIPKMIDAMMQPRFTQPWGRAQVGGSIKDLLYELNLLMYLLPPLAGLMLARRERYGFFQLVSVCAVAGFTLFQGFSSGTRSLFGTYLVTFVIAYAFALPRQRRFELALVGAGAAVVMLSATYFMLQFRTVGMKNYMEGTYERTKTLQSDFVFVDYNLLALNRLAEVFPRQRPFLGFEIPYFAVIRPIPRLLWPGKPVKLSLSIEEVFGVKGVTIAATFAGEAYMSGGYVGVFLIAMALSLIYGWWSGLASPRNSEMGILIYASGFFATVITMRSLLAFSTAILPTIASLVGTHLLIQSAGAVVKRIATHQPGQKPVGPSARTQNIGRRP